MTQVTTMYSILCDVLKTRKLGYMVIITIFFFLWYSKPKYAEHFIVHNLLRCNRIPAAILDANIILTHSTLQITLWYNNILYWEKGTEISIAFLFYFMGGNHLENRMYSFSVFHSSIQSLLHKAALSMCDNIDLTLRFVLQWPKQINWLWPTTGSRVLYNKMCSVLYLPPPFLPSPSVQWTANVVIHVHSCM